ncbi:DUF721 domain-containing protein [Tanticharoenia sakaeratensis]|jgi:hypothetical protein|uniref:DUF721 domain-containing protein n=1 Tax=Tanticharoenia sakaeratensis NBRC 103193 TaxID=1231623 RepID=A0A0D6MM70_9PROT|nr:DUF721 domain-containing protein [Tanticharoenia sakaeratensis]GAN54551.1 hypothetical protein Tasa_024_017 [Tanticharoenia sakaeratensis NBRC 103193]GBQ24453.1 hypothetical protein AA103193_2758 [Tanticharoenia sakaeratensis NBRC 103193]
MAKRVANRKASGKGGGGDASDAAWTARRTGVARTLGALLPKVTESAFRKRPAASGRLALDWGIIAGPKLSAVTEPRRLSAGTLTLACSGPMALELQHLSPQIIARVNRHFGQTIVERLRFVQDATLPLPRTARPAPAEPVAVDGVDDPALAEALGRLGARIAARAASARRKR